MLCMLCMFCMFCIIWRTYKDSIHHILVAVVKSPMRLETGCNAVRYDRAVGPSRPHGTHKPKAARILALPSIGDLFVAVKLLPS